MFAPIIYILVRVSRQGRCQSEWEEEGKATSTNLALQRQDFIYLEWLQFHNVLYSIFLPVFGYNIWPS